MKKLNKKVVDAGSHVIALNGKMVKKVVSDEVANQIVNAIQNDGHPIIGKLHDQGGASVVHLVAASMHKMDHKMIEAFTAAHEDAKQFAKTAFVDYDDHHCTAGFAWIELTDKKQAKLFEQLGLGDAVSIWMGEYYDGQSLWALEAVAERMAATLNSHGIKAIARSRVD